MRWFNVLPPTKHVKSFTWALHAWHRTCFCYTNELIWILVQIILVAGDGTVIRVMVITNTGTVLRPIVRYLKKSRLNWSRSRTLGLEIRLQVGKEMNARTASVIGLTANVCRPLLENSRQLIHSLSTAWCRTAARGQSSSEHRITLCCPAIHAGSTQTP